MNEAEKQSGDHSRRRRHRALLAASLLVIAVGVAAGAILMPQEMARRATRAPEPSHSHFHRRAPVPEARRTPFMRGICWEGAGKIDSTDLDPLTRIRANWISQTPFGWMLDASAPDIRTSYDRPRPWSGFW